MKISKLLIVVIGAFLILSDFSISFAQKTFNTEIKLKYIIFNSDTLRNETSIKTQIKNNIKHRITIWENGDEKIAAVIVLNDHENKSSLRIRFDTWNGKKWKKQKFKFWCEGLHCSFSRYLKVKWKEKGSIGNREKSESIGFETTNHFPKSDNSVTVFGTYIINY